MKANQDKKAAGSHGFMSEAIREAHAGVKKGHGGPFGAVIVRNGKVISGAHNMVVKNKEPTAHAEVMVIRKAAKKLKRWDLSECELYTTCEPCPMCLGAILWSRIKKVHYGCTREDAEEIGFNDSEYYKEISKLCKPRKGKSKTSKPRAGKRESSKAESKYKSKLIEIKSSSRQECLEVFREWKNKKGRVVY
jgi:guanine deaminase